MEKLPALPVFDVNAVAVHTWMADGDLRVRSVNRSYRDWLKRNLPEVEREVGRRGGLELGEFLRKTLPMTPMVERQMLADVGEWRTALDGPLRETKPYREDGVEVSREMSLVSEQLVGSVRVGAVSQYRMSEGQRKTDLDFHELLIAGQFRKLEGKWVLQGLQGTVQSLGAKRSAVEFDANAMLVHSWVADRNQNVTFVNRSLREWLKRNLPEIEEKINSKNGLGIRNFLKQTLQISDEVEGEIAKRLENLEEHVNNPPNEEPYQVDGLEVRRYIDRVGEHVVAGVRAVTVSGFAMPGRKDLEFVDVVVVAQLKKEKGLWTITGYQGMLQSASTRAELIFREGTRSGAVALMGRNLSHNIGSHALYWLEQADASRQDEETGARAAAEAAKRPGMEAAYRDVPRATNGEPDAEQSGLFYKYLRERMELLAGFATSIPLSPRTIEFTSLVDDFSRHKILLKFLCKSESVDEVTIEYEDRKRYVVSIPGGAMGVQAFYSMLENILRDNAKYGPHEGVMNTVIETATFTEEARRDHLRVSVVGQEADNTDDAYAIIKSALDPLEITNESGRLKEGFWGIKERFIAAALLRGIKLEDVGFRVEHGEKTLVSRDLARSLEDQPPILDVRKKGRSLVWDFYLLLAKDVLVVDDAGGEGRQEGTEWHGMEWLKENLGSASAIRHSFISISAESRKDAEWLRANRERLPFRTFLASVNDAGAEIPGREFARFRGTAPVGASATKERLYSAWLEWLEPEVARKFILIDGKRGRHILRWNDERDEPVDEGEFRSLSASRDCAGVFYRHWTGRHLEENAAAGKYCEVYGQCPSVMQACERRVSGIEKFALFESALIRVLLVDERLDQSSDRIVQPRLGITLRERMAMKGIDIRGREYSGSNIPEVDELLMWAAGHNGRRYHFVCVHRGILDKLSKLKETKVAEVCEALGRLTANVLVHSGRVGRTGLPNGIRFIPLSNVIAWLDTALGKMDVVDELCLIRRTE